MNDRGRGVLWKTDIKAFQFAIATKGEWDKKKLLELHRILGSCRPDNYVHGYTPNEWVGRFRKYSCGAYRSGVLVASFPDPKKVPALMDRWFAMHQGWGAWEAHRVYEKIHPFADLNGRTGRLIWASMMWENGWKPSIKQKSPFLLEYYYQSLQDPMLMAKIENFLSAPSKPE